MNALDENSPRYCVVLFLQWRIISKINFTSYVSFSKNFWCALDGSNMSTRGLRWVECVFFRCSRTLAGVMNLVWRICFCPLYNTKLSVMTFYSSSAVFDTWWHACCSRWDVTCLWVQPTVIAPHGRILTGQVHFFWRRDHGSCFYVRSGRRRLLSMFARCTVRSCALRTIVFWMIRMILGLQ